jgi:hypothetical protein
MIRKAIRPNNCQLLPTANSLIDRLERMESPRFCFRERIVANVDIGKELLSKRW